jgi:hypothetical protein
MADLHGSLSVLSLPGLLQLLASEQRSGRLEVLDAAGVSLASLWLDEGRVVHVAGAGGDADAAHEDVVAGLLGHDDGRFRFRAGGAPPRRTLQLAVGELLMEAACRRDHARRAAEGLALDAVPVLAPVPHAGTTPSFNTLQWRLLASIDGHRDVTALAAELGLPPSATARLLAELVEAGVLEILPA